jgi:hypothetical protein
MQVFFLPKVLKKKKKKARLFPHILTCHVAIIVLLLFQSSLRFYQTSRRQYFHVDCLAEKSGKAREDASSKTSPGAVQAISDCLPTEIML